VKRADKYSVVPSQSTRFKFNHQPLDLFSASSLSLRDFSDFYLPTLTIPNRPGPGGPGCAIGPEDDPHNKLWQRPGRRFRPFGRIFHKNAD